MYPSSPSPRYSRHNYFKLRRDKEERKKGRKVIWRRAYDKDHADSERGNPLPPLHRLLFPIGTMDLLYAPSYRQHSRPAYHGVCYTSGGALATPTNSLYGPHDESIPRLASYCDNWIEKEWWVQPFSVPSPKTVSIFNNTVNTLYWGSKFVYDTNSSNNTNISTRGSYVVDIRSWCHGSLYQSYMVDP